MASLKLAPRAGGWWHMASLCTLVDLSTIGCVNRPLLVAGDRIKVVNSSTSVHLTNYLFQSLPRGVRCTCQRHESVFAMMRSPSRDDAAQSSSIVRTEVIASSFSSAASSVSSTSVEPEDVLQFWFKDVDPERNVYASKNWFLGGPDFDKEIETKFGDCLKLAAAGALDGWKDSVRGRLALVLILDQFSRNIYRKSPLAYASDEKARKITLETIAQGLDKQLAPMERVFLYLPLMHSENLEHHDISASVYKGLAAEYSDNEQLHQQILSSVAFEERHRAVLEQFGRYPSRNEDFGRESTPEELEHLKNGPSW